MRPTPLQIACPTCTAKAGEHCRVRKTRGTYRSGRHVHVAGPDGRPMHETRIDKAADMTYDWLPFAPMRRTGRAERLRIDRQYRPWYMPKRPPERWDPPQ